MNFVYIFVISFFVAFIFIPYLIKLAFKIGLVDSPNKTLKSHKYPVAYLGGLAVFFGFASTFYFWFYFDTKLIFSFLGLFSLLLLGLIDDAYVLSPITKLIGQIFSVFLFLKAGFFINIDLLGVFFSMIFSVIWMLSIINAFNLIDVMDGLSSSVALASSLMLLIFTLFLNNSYVSIILVAFAAALFAFFIKNFPPAKIYLGDSGSLFLGGFFCFITLLIQSLNQFNGLVVAFIFPLMFFVPILELFSLIVIRSYRNIPFFLGSKDHFSIYLKNNGWSVKHILAFSFFMQICFGLWGLLFLINYLSLYSLLLLVLVQLSFWIYCMDFKKNVAFCLKSKKTTNY